MKWRYLVTVSFVFAAIVLLLMFQVNIKAHALGKEVFTDGAFDYEIIAEGWSILWRLWPVFIPIILIISLFTLGFGASLGHYLYKGELKNRIYDLEGRVNEEIKRANRAEVEAAQDAHHRLEAEHQNIKRLRANLDKRQALHEEREARIENAEYEIDVYKQNIEKRALQAESERDEALQVAQQYRNQAGMMQRIKNRTEKKLEVSRQRVSRLQAKVESLKEMIHG